MGQLAAGIAHEVNNPLGILLLHANLLLEECEDDTEVKRRPGDHRRPGQPLQADHLRPAQLRPPEPGGAPAHRRRRAGRQGPPHRPHRRQRHGRRSRTALADPVAEIDADQIVQVLTNLFTNAQQAMPDGGALTIALRRHRRRASPSRSPTRARGIPKENMAKLFDPFFTTKQVGMGTGLGLAVTHGIVKMHRGQITVESNADPAAGPTGTTFTIDLPRHEASSRTPASRRA